VGGHRRAIVPNETGELFPAKRSIGMEIKAPTLWKKVCLKPMLLSTYFFPRLELGKYTHTPIQDKKIIKFHIKKFYL